MYRPIQDYAIIGNLRSAALVAKDGTIEWAPAPFLDSPSVFAALLDDEKGGRWSIQPTATFEVSQSYVPETNILKTKFQTKEGVLEVLDCMPICGQNGMNNHTRKENGTLAVPPEEQEIFEIHRKVVCVEGKCAVNILFEPRFNYAQGETRLSLTAGGVLAEQDSRKGILISRAQYEVKDNCAQAKVSLQKGDTHYLTFRYNTVEIPYEEDLHYEEDMECTKKWWEDWVHRCDLESCPVQYPWHEQVMRSSLVLKIMFFEPPGSIAAAATTSLPEEIGGVRNWDYRFSWVRDSAFTLQALFWLGYIKEANEYVRWLVSECRRIQEDDPSGMQIMYGLRGQHELEEQILPHLEGYRGSKPVRVGNAAYKQQQWDIYGGILNTIWRLREMRNDYEMQEDIWRALRAFANYVVKIWREPDEGLWEVRGGKRHFVHSKVMCWVALDRAVKLAEAYGLEGETDLWKKEAEAIKEEILEKGWSEKKQSFVQSYGSESVDTSLLLMPVLGFIDGKDPKMRSTLLRVEQELSAGDGLFFRYNTEDGLPGAEGAFLLASFWFVDALLLAGEREKAENLFEQLLHYQNHVGLYSEEMDPKTKSFLGNFPQAYTHIGLINSAFYLSFSDATLEAVFTDKKTKQATV